ncbi:pseudouridine synthase [Ornithinibacillus halophilus]|uniref:Pseudouridine synthase n=1 Tax=Ornithinibacillus halophilus TaxID=930117 RepID=A0A1M5ENF0_9BACI|nr:pseudouridine synthase [Ornithinibacillus halophilus]SHF80621.1 16S rRNA pseudouridine516 synthase [Ornithinibacillus halophilus]
MRLDKLLSNMGYGSRKDVKSILKKKDVTVNDKIVKDGSIHVEPNKDVIKVKNEIVEYQEYIYLMMNKPPGVISATEDNRGQKTVVDILPDTFQLFNPFPVGRLDKDTEGLLLLTNDGKLAHQLLSPKKDFEKTYYAEIEGTVTEDDINAFRDGVILDDGYKTKPAKLTILLSEQTSKVEITITEGKFHQVKRMFRAVNKKVKYLKRVSMGELQLDESLKLGEFRELYKNELDYLLALK